MPRYTLGSAQIKILVVIGICALAVAYAIFKGTKQPAPPAPLVPVASNPATAPVPGKPPKLVPLTPNKPAAGKNAVAEQGSEENAEDDAQEPSPEQKTYEKAAEVFDGESVDAEWAPQYQEEITTMFGDAEALSQVSVNSIECRTSMCRVVVFTPTLVEANQLNSVFYATIGNYKGGMFKNSNIMGLNNFANGVTALYIAKPGTELSLF